MSSYTESHTGRTALPLAVAVFIVFGMGVVYTALDMAQPAQPWQALLAFLPGTLSALALIAAGFLRTELYLRPAALSRPGLVVLAAVFVLLLPILGSSTGWAGWEWLPALVYAPASGVAQELYFRASLLPALEKALGGRRVAALLVQAMLFVGFHLRTFASLPSLPVGLVVATVLFLAGCGWGWQVQRDRTVGWAMLQHSLFLCLMSMFGWPAPA